MKKCFCTLALPIIVMIWLPGLCGQDWEILENCRLVPHSSNDGDSFRVEHRGETYLFRLYHVDTPEDRLSFPKRVEQQADYFGVSVDQTLDYATDASRVTERFLNRRFTIKTQWIDARGMSRIPRFYALVMNADDEYLGHHLVGRGLARIYGMPIRGDRPPGGPRKERYVRDLKKAESAAKREGLGAWRRSRHDPSAESAPALASTELPADKEGAASPEGLLDPNMADSVALQAVPGIGPVYANRIIENRPFSSVDDLIRVKGIGAATLARIRPYFYLEPPPTPEGTAEYFLGDAERWLNQVVTVQVRAAKTLDEPAPDGFSILELETGTEAAAHGSLRAYLPNEDLPRAMEYFKIPNQSFAALLYDLDGYGPVLVVRRSD